MINENRMILVTYKLRGDFYPLISHVYTSKKIFFLEKTECSIITVKYFKSLIRTRYNRFSKFLESFGPSRSLLSSTSVLKYLFFSFFARINFDVDDYIC